MSALPDHRCARGCGRIVYFDGDVCTADADGNCYPYPCKNETEIKAEMKRILALAKRRSSAFEAECEAGFKAWAAERKAS